MFEVNIQRLRATVVISKDLKSLTEIYVEVSGLRLFWYKIRNQARTNVQRSIVRTWKDDFRKEGQRSANRSHR